MKESSAINFMGMRVVFLLLSLGLIAISLWQWTSTGDEKYSVDFLGGVDLSVKFEPHIEISTIRKALADGGFEGAIVQELKDLLAGEIDSALHGNESVAKGNEFSIRLKADKDLDTAGKIRQTLAAIPGHTIDVRKEDFVGPTIGEEIRNSGLTALGLALFGMLIYISFRFEWRFACGALAALVHDVIITTGIFLLSGREISTAVLAALLTIVGYSLNDTIVVFDRIRENIYRSMKKGGKKIESSNFLDLVNMSINQTLSRTILTSLTTLFVVTTLWLLGGGAVSDLAFTLVVGVAVGTYSSIFIASPVVIALEKSADVKGG